MITRLTAEITPINCATLKNVVFPIQIPKNNEPSHKAEITILKPKDKENLYNSLQIDVYGCELSIESNHVIETPDNIYNVMARTILEEFLTILGFCLGFIISTESVNVISLPMRLENLPETEEEKRQFEILPKIVIAQICGGAIITSSSTTNDDIFNYYNLIDPISFFMNAEKAVSPILKIREYLIIFEFFNEKYKNDSRFTNKGKEELSRDIINEYTGQDVSANTIEDWWCIDNRCSRGHNVTKRQEKRKRAEIDSECSHRADNYITSLNPEGLEEVNKAIKEIRRFARLLIEKIAHSSDIVS
jgi:hypothetical protein